MSVEAPNRGDEVNTVSAEEAEAKGPLLPTVMLREAIVLPGQQVTIHGLSDRSMKALQAGLASQAPILLALAQREDVELPGAEDIYPIGTTGVVLRMLRFHDGSVRALVEGVDRVRVVGVEQLEPVLLARIESAQRAKESSKATALMMPIQQQLRSYIGSTHELPTEVELVATRKRTPDELANYVAGVLPLTHQQRLEFLGAETTEQRLELVLGWLSSQREHAEIRAEVMGKVQATMDKSQREYMLREQIKELRQELGEIAPNEQEDDKLKEQTPCDSDTHKLQKRSWTD